MPAENDTAAAGNVQTPDMDSIAGGADITSFGDDQLTELLAHDPFSEEPGGEQKQGVEGEDDSAAAAAGAADETGGDDDAASTTSSGDDDGEQNQSTQTGSDGEELTTLRAQVAALSARLQQQDQTQGADTGGQQTQDQQQQQQADEPSFRFTIPQELHNLLNSDEATERQQGLSLFAEGIARGAFQQAQARLEQALTERIPQIVNERIAQSRNQQQMKEDFYGSHPDLNNEAFAPVILQVARQVAQEKGYESWNKDLRDTTATRVRKLLQMPEPKKGKAAPRPPATVPRSGNGARTTARPNAKYEIEDFVFGALNQR